MSQHTDTMEANYMRRLLRPYWVDNMFAWQWEQNGMRVGPAILAQNSAGKANLLWLALDLQRPPTQVVDVRKNLIYGWVVMEGHLYGLEQAAAMYTLPEFEQRLTDMIAQCSQPRAKQMMVFLQMLARRRLNA